MFSWLIFGKRIDAGIQSYGSALYEQARYHFEAALLINPEDFIVNFWMLRVHTRLMNCQTAQEYAVKCTALRPDLKELVDCWLSQTASLAPVSQVAAELEMTVDQKIRDYHKSRRYGKRDIFIILSIFAGLFIALVILAGIFAALNIAQLERMQQDPALRVACFDAMSIPFVIYYCRKPKLIQNFWLQIKEAKILFQDVTFRKWLSLILVVKIIVGLIILFTGNKAMQNNVIYLVPGVIISSVLSAPITEEVVYRGIAFQSLKQFNRIFAYIGSALLFYLNHGSDANDFHFMIGILLAYLYERYNTLVAPIIMHSINNMILPIFVMLYHRIIPILS